MTHDWIPSTLGHGETMCRNCKITNREAAVLGELNECPVLENSMDDLIKRLEAAPDNNDLQLWYDVADFVWPEGKENGDFNQFILWISRHAYTEAALMLVPEGWCFKMRDHDGGECWLDYYKDHRDKITVKGPVYGNAHTPALAICIACLKAMNNE